jgi:hypothetical protein
VVPKNAKNVEVAKKMMKFISSGDVALKWEKYSKCPSGLKSRAAFNEFGTNAFSRFSQHIRQKYNNRLEEVNLGKILFRTNNSIDFVPQKVVTGDISVTDAINYIKSQLK